LVSILLLNLLGGPAYFAAQLLQQQRIMRDLIAKTPKGSLTRISLTISEFKKAKIEDNELLLNGEMFDVAYFEVDQSGVIVYGLFDVRENELLNSLRGQSSRQTQNETSSQVITRFLALNYLVEYFLLPDNESLQRLIQFDSRSAMYETLEQPITCPPPEEFDCQS
jgi:hypothetical protein